MGTELARLVIAVDSSQAKTAQKDLRGLEAAGSSLGKMLGGLAIGAGLTAMAKHIFNATAEFQKLQAQLVTVTGSAALAGKAFKEIEQFAAETPFQLGEVVQAFIKMKAMGLDPSMENLRAWGDLASANGKNILDTVQAVANATMGEAEMLKQFGIKMMQSGDQVKFTYNGITTTVARNSEAIEAHLLKLAKTNFGGGMAREMDTIGGAMSNLQDQVDKTSRAIGSAFADQSFGGIRALTQTIDDLTAPLTRLAGDYSNLIDAVNRGNGPMLKLSGVLGAISFNLQMMTLGIAGAKDVIGNLGSLVTQSGAIMTTAWWTREGQQKLLDRYSFSNTKAAAQDVKMSRFLASRPDITKDLFELGQDVPLTQQERIAAEQKRLKELAGTTNEATKATTGFVDSLKQQVAQLGLTETQVLRYKAAQLGLSDNQTVKALIARVEAWEAEEKAIEDTTQALEVYAGKAQALGQAEDGIAKVLEDMQRFGPEAMAKLRGHSEELDRIKDQYDELGQASRYWQNDFTNALVEMTFTGKNLWRDMVDAMLRDLARLAVQKQITEPFFNWLGKIPWGGGSTSGSALGDLVSTTAGSALGGPAPSGLRSQGSAPIIVNVNQESGSVTTQGSGDGARLGRLIGQKVREVLDEEKRAGGRLDFKGAR